MHYVRIASWWLNHPFPQKICSSNWIISPRIGVKIKRYLKPPPTLPETNIAPENGWLEDEFPFLGRPIFRGCDYHESLSIPVQSLLRYNDDY